MRSLLVLLLAVLTADPANPSEITKTSSTFYPAAARANARANGERYEWARRRIEQAVAEAEPWVKANDDDLWQMIIPPKLKRAIMVNVNKGCPNCGMAMYGEAGPRPYAWIAWVEGHPWKVQCPNCKELFPKNDFGRFYQSAIDPATGLFDPARGDRSLLFNTDHPDPADPKHGYGVDDGSGWPRFGTDPADRDWYVGYHVFFGRNGRTTAAIRALATAYSLTGEPRCAHKCAILLDRLADVYPDYNGMDEQLFNNVWHRYSEGGIGPNYWEGSAWAQRAIDYDMICDGIGAMPETLAFLQAKARRYRTAMPKDSVTDIHHNIQQRILVEMGRHHDRIWMNGTITEMCQAKVDLVLRGRSALADFVNRHMPAIVPPQHLNDDGSGNEQSTGYDSGAFGQYCSLLEDLASLDRGVAKAAIEGYPRFRAAFDFWPDIWCLEKFIPQVGDVGEPGGTRGIPGSPGAYLAMYDLTGRERYAQVAMRMVNGDASKLPRNIYAADPEGLIERTVQADKAAGPWFTPSLVKPDYGLAILRSGRGAGRQALWLHYSSRAGTSSHSQFDALHFGLYAFDLELVCEHGYPLYTGDWPARWAWTSHTRSHATVSVDNQCQKHCPGGTLLGFASDDEAGLQMVSAEAPCVYEHVSIYRRTMVCAEVSPSQRFVIDVFRVKGGREHTYNVPFFYGELQGRGFDAAPHPDVHDGYVRQVAGGAARSPWRVDATILSAWQGTPAAHLRVHGVPFDGKVLLGRGESRWGASDPRWLPYLLLRREGGQQELDSTFVAVYEPYKDEPFLAERPLPATISAEAVELDVATSDGRCRYRITVEDGDAAQVKVRGTRTGTDGERSFALSGIHTGT